MKPNPDLTAQVRFAIREATYTNLPEYDAHNAAEAAIQAVIEFITNGRAA
jgi:hypothetical protein